MHVGRLLCFALLLGLTTTPAVADEPFFCSRTGSYVELGDTSAEVLAKCGPPTSRDEIKMPRRRGYDLLPRWFYDFGETSFVRIVVFQKDRVLRIEVNGYGK
jgi:Protein of unknown function (DUF2845)